MNYVLSFLEQAVMYSSLSQKNSKWLPWLAIICGVFMVCSAQHAQAGTKVVGVEIGVSTIEQVRNQASALGGVRNGGTNTWSGGPTLEVPGSSYDIQGLDSALFIFMPDGKLAAVVMTMQNHRFNEVFDVLAGKYKMTKKDHPLIGNNFARFSAPGAVIEIDAPHLSFEMQVRYMSDAFAKIWQQGVQSKIQQKRDSDKNSF